MNKQLQIVTFDQAKKLKELGFDWLDNNLQIFKISEDNNGFLMNGNAIWDEDEKIIEDNKWCHAPTTALTLKWLRDEKNLIVSVHYESEKKNDKSGFEWMLHNILSGTFIKSWESTYEEAESAGLDYALDYLLKPFTILKY